MGTKPYVFISYAHKNNNLVFPAIQELQKQGVEVWYDNGIEAGSEWPEFVAEKVMNCSKFVLFISKDYLESQNCKRELNFAISRKKEILSIFLEDVMLSPGMEMQLGTYQAIFCKRFSGMSQFYKTLSVEPFFNSCRQNSVQPGMNSEPKQTYTPRTEAAGVRSNNNYSGQAYTKSTGSYTSGRPTRKNKWIAILLALFLGSFGAHKFYLGKTKQGIFYLVFLWTYIPTIVSLVECVIMLFQNEEQFERSYR